MMLLSNNEMKLPLRQIELTSPWDLGGDGKCYFHGDPTEEWYVKLMRK